MNKAPHLRSIFRSCAVERLHAVGARSTCRSQNLQNTIYLRHFWTLKRRFAWQAQGIVVLSKVSKKEGVCSIFKRMAVVGHGKRICKDAFSVAGAVQETCSSELLGGPGADFLRGVAFWSIRSSVLGRWFLRDRCSTSYDLASLFRRKRNTLDRRGGKIAKRIGTRPSALHSTFNFWRESPRIASFLMLPSSKKWGSVAKQLRFQACR